MKKLLIVILLFISGCITSNVILETEGPFTVTKVIDGDTLIANNQTIRLSGINAPETSECYYQEAKDILTALTLNKQIHLEKDISNKDKYKRLLRYIYLDNLSINSYLTEAGYVKVYDKYANDTKRYKELKQREEAEKRLLARGRADDVESSIKNRMDWFDEDVMPILDYYKKDGRLIEVNGEQSPEEVFSELEKNIENYFSKK